MMHIFHKWGEWSDEKLGVFGFFGIKGEQKRTYQDRHCEICNKHQWRFM